MGQDYTDGGGNINCTSLDDVSADDLPNALIVTSLDVSVFNSPQDKEQFEAIFKEIDNSVTFQYFKSFKRARVNFSSPLTAAKARIECHQRKFGNSMINCYFAQVLETSENTSSYNRLCPPAPSRQFLISPPASPPVGWEPREEAEPIINYDLITAITNLTPGETHEIHPPSRELPAIVVHVCEDVSLPEEETNLSSDEGGTPGKPRIKIQQTRRPPVRSSSEGSEDSCDSLSLTQ